MTLTVTALTIILAVVMLILTLVFGLLPIRVLKYLRNSASRHQHSTSNGTVSSQDDDISGGRGWPGMVLSLLSCFTGGVFLATCFLHLLPDVQERLDKMKARFNWTTEYPYAELVSCVGFFLVYFVEEIVISFLKGGESRHSHSLNVGTKAANPVFTTSLDVAEPERCEANGKDTPFLMNTGPNAHSHEIRSITLVLALSFHSVIEGIAFGIARTKEDFTALFLTLIVHKVIVSFAMQLARTHAHKLWFVLTSICLFAAMSPLGTIIGILIEVEAYDSKGKEIVLLIFEGMAVGTFLYVTFFEVLIHERDNEYPNLVKLLVVMVGFSLIAVLGLIGEHSGSTTNTTLANSTTPLPAFANYSTPSPALYH